MKTTFFLSMSGSRRPCYLESWELSFNNKVKGAIRFLWPSRSIYWGKWPKPKCNERSKLKRRRAYPCSRNSLSTHEWAFGFLLTLSVADSRGVLLLAACLPCYLPTNKQKATKAAKSEVDSWNRSLSIYPRVIFQLGTCLVLFLRGASRSTWVCCSWRLSGHSWPLFASSITRSKSLAQRELAATNTMDAGNKMGDSQFAPRNCYPLMYDPLCSWCLYTCIDQG
jgi:hypothetical protein